MGAPVPPSLYVWHTMKKGMGALLPKVQRWTNGYVSMEEKAKTTERE